MPINELFNAHQNTLEQDLMADLVEEAIQVKGQNYNYLDRTTGNKDKILFEDTISSFNRFTIIEMYMTTIDSFEGDEEILGKFGIDIPHQTKLAISTNAWKTLMETPFGIVEPRPGDLIHWPVTDDIFQISFVDKKQPFFQLGASQMWLLTVEKFQYAHETFATGLAVVDNYVASIDDIEDDPFAMNDDLDAEADLVLDFTELNPFTKSAF